MDMEAETAIKIRQLELQTATVSSPGSVRSSNNTFDVNRNISLVSPFCESEVESYFSAFECLTIALHWPRDVWAIILQCNLAGKAQKASFFSVSGGQPEL